MCQFIDMMTFFVTNIVTFFHRLRVFSRPCSLFENIKTLFFVNHLSFTLAVIILISLPNLALAWPADNDWHAIYRGLDQLGDPQKDATGNDARDIVGDTTNSAAYLYSDGNFIYFRIRVDSDPRQNVTTGTMIPFGWGLLVDTNENLDDYEYMVMLDGINNPDVMYLCQNTLQGTLGDASDKCEIIRWQETLNYNNNYRVLGPTDSGGPTTTFGGDDDFFIDWMVPYAVFKSSLGLDETTVIRYFVGSANNAMVLNADLVAGSTLYDGTSNYVLPSGVQPVSGYVFFVKNPDGSEDLSSFYAGNPIYVKVTDADLNLSSSALDTATVTITVPSGDTETYTLTETGIDTGIFVGEVITTDGSFASDGILQILPAEIITVTYIDAADETAPTPLTNQVRTDTASAKPAADIEVIKTVDDNTPSEGDTITYSVTLINHGPSATSGIQVSDPLPSGVTYISHTAPAGTSYSPGGGLWSAGALAVGTSTTLTISATVDNGTAGSLPIVNTATKISATQVDLVPANDSDSASISVTGADLAVTKTIDNPSPGVGGTVNFTITVTNNGSFEANNVEVTDILPTATWSAISLTSISQGTTSYIGDNFVWTIGTLPYTTPTPTSVTLELAATLDPSVAIGTVITNTASITATDQNDPDSGNDSASVQLVVGSIDLSISKSLTTTPSPNVGDTVSFLITVNNDASASTTATGIVVDDPLPSGLTYLSATPSQGSYASGNGQWNIGSLAPGTNATLILQATVASGTAGQTLTNTATISAYNEPDADSSNHSASDSVVIKAIDLLIEKSVDTPAPTATSGTLNYTVTVTNLSTTESVTGISIFDQLPGATVWSSDTTSGGTASGSYSTTTHYWSGISLAAYDPANPAQTDHSAQLVITVTYSVGNNDPKTFYNTASLSDSTPEDSNSTNDTSTATVSINGTDLRLSKEMNTGYNDYPASGSTTQFLITLTNDGPTVATDVEIKDILPANFSCDNGSVTAPDTFANNGSNCNWTVDSIAVNESRTLVLTSTVSAANGTLATNRATILSSDQPDPNSGNNTATKLVYVGGSDLALSKTVDNPTPNEGDIVEFTITVSNEGTNSVDSIEVTDLVPAGLTLQTTAPNAPVVSQGSFDAATGVWSVGTVTYVAGPPEVKGNATLTLYAQVDTGTSGAALTNSATITAAGALDPVSSNNSASASVLVQQADVYVNKNADTLNPFVDGTVVFTITAGNNGPHLATNVLIEDIFPSTDLTYVTTSVTDGTYDEVSGQWSGISIAKGSTQTLTITATVNGGTYGTNIVNTANIVSLDQYDPNAANDSQSVVITPDAIDLSLAKSADTTTPAEGGNVVFTLTVTNTDGAYTATGIQVTDLLSDYGFTYVSDVPQAPTTYDSASGVWDIGALAPSASVTLTLTGSVPAGSGGSTLTNTATITAADQYDNNSANNTASIAITPVAAPNLTIVKMASTLAAQPGSTILYTVQVANSGSGSGESIFLTDRLSPYVALRLDTFSGAPFQFIDGTPSSGLTMGTPVYSNDVNGASFLYTPTSGGGGAPAGFDTNITHWRIPFTGTLDPSGGNFTIRYQVVVE